MPATPRSCRTQSGAPADLRTQHWKETLNGCSVIAAARSARIGVNSWHPAQGRPDGTACRTIAADFWSVCASIVPCGRVDVPHQPCGRAARSSTATWMLSKATSPSRRTYRNVRCSTSSTTCAPPATSPTPDRLVRALRRAPEPGGPPGREGGRAAAPARHPPATRPGYTDRGRPHRGRVDGGSTW